MASYCSTAGVFGPTQWCDDWLAVCAAAWSSERPPTSSAVFIKYITQKNNWETNCVPHVGATNTDCTCWIFTQHLQEQTHILKHSQTSALLVYVLLIGLKRNGVGSVIQLTNLLLPLSTLTVVNAYLNPRATTAPFPCMSQVFKADEFSKTGYHMRGCKLNHKSKYAANPKMSIVFILNLRLCYFV